MNVKWETCSSTDGSTYQQLLVSKVSDWKLFEKVAKKIADKFEGKWVEKINGFDQRYWDYRSNDAEITLHLELYLGIMIYPKAGSMANKQSLDMMDGLFQLFSIN